MASIKSNLQTVLVFVILLTSNINSQDDDISMNMITTENPLEDCTFNITITNISNPVTQYCPNKRKHKYNDKRSLLSSDDNRNENKNRNDNDQGNKDRNENKNRDENSKNGQGQGQSNKNSNSNGNGNSGNDKYGNGNGKYDSSDEDNSRDGNYRGKDTKNTNKRRPKLIKACITYAITGQMTTSSQYMSIFLPLCPQGHRYGMRNISVSNITELITNDTFKNGTNVETAIGYLKNDKLGILVRLIDETAGGFELCLQNIKQKRDNSLDIEKIGRSDGIVSVNSTNECVVHGLPCFKFKFRKTCDRMQDRYNNTSTISPDNDIMQDNALLNNDQDNTSILNGILGVSKGSMWGIIIVLVVLLGCVIAYLRCVFKKKKSEVYHSAIPNENEVEMEDKGHSDNEGENSEFEMITTTK